MGVPDETKRCSRCGETKPVSEFSIKNKKTGLLTAWCRDCRRAYGREHYQANTSTYIARSRRRRREQRPRIREAIYAYLREHPCVDCGERDILLLDFDHRDRSSKRDVVARLARSGTLRAVMLEIGKCDVRCGKCHRKRTAAQMNWRKSPTFEGDHRAPLPALRRAPRASATGRPVTEQLSIWSVGLTKWCSRCARFKPLHDFAFHDRATGRRQHHCRPCQAELRRDHYRRNREHYIGWAIRQTRRRRDEHVALVHEYLRSHPCVDCGESDIQLLEFDHADGTHKLMPISTLLGRRNTATLLAEIAKCDVRCVNCHRRRTAERFKWSKRLGEDAVSYNVGARGCVVVVANEVPNLAAWVRSPSPAQF